MKDHDDSIQGSIHGATPQIRLVKGMNALLEHRERGLVHYTQSARRMTIVRKKLIPPFGKTVIYEDCSSAATGLYWMAGLHDPNDMHYNGFGYTGTLCLNGRKLRPWEKPRVGDLVFYGSSGPPWTHVAVVYSAGKAGVRVFSHGHEGDPTIRPIDYRGDRGQIRRYLK